MKEGRGEEHPIQYVHTNMHAHTHTGTLRMEERTSTTLIAYKNDRKQTERTNERTKHTPPTQIKKAPTSRIYKGKTAEQQY